MSILIRRSDSNFAIFIGKSYVISSNEVKCFAIGNPAKANAINLNYTPGILDIITRGDNSPSLTVVYNGITNFYVFAIYFKNASDFIEVSFCWICRILLRQFLSNYDFTCL